MTALRKSTNLRRRSRLFDFACTAPALLLFISGIILSSQLAKDARDFEFQLQTVQHWRNSAEKEN